MKSTKENTMKILTTIKNDFITPYNVTCGATDVEVVEVDNADNSGCPIMHSRADRPPTYSVLTGVRCCRACVPCCIAWDSVPASSIR